MTILIFIVSLLGAIAIGVPIAWALLLCGISLMFWMDIFDVQILAQTLVNGADSFSLLAIPFFVLAGEIMNAGGLSQRIVDLPMKLVGHRPGGLGYVGVLAAMIMASLSGSAVADTAAVAALLVPMMRQANYPVNRAAGLIGSGGIIAAIIPPSIPLIIFGVSSGLSISKLFMAGIAPGIMMGVTLMVTWWWQAKRLNLPCQPKASLREVWQSLVSGIWALFLPIIIIGGFRSGLSRPHQGAHIMSRPLLQLALDHSSLEAAQRDVTRLKDSVDIVEAGTILCLNEGLGAVKALREQCPDKIIVADWKVADAGETLAQQAFGAGANWMTIICAAPLATVEKGHAMAQRCGGEIQIELFGNWTLDDARDWHRIGVRQAIYHRGRDAQASGQQWGEADLARMKALSDIGLELSITGGITPADLPLFKEIRVKAFIAGRALAGAANPAQVAGDFHAQIDSIWGGKRA